MSDDLKTVASFSTPIEADIVRNRLEAAGVQAFLADENTIGWLWHLGTALSGVKVVVAESDLPQAVGILEQTADESAEAWTCLKCEAQVDGLLDVCWSCGTTCEGEEDPEFAEVDAPPVREPVETKGPPGPMLALIIGFCLPWTVLNGMVGFEILAAYALSPVAGVVILLLLAANVLLITGFVQGLYYAPPTAMPWEGETGSADLEEDPQAAWEEIHAIALRAWVAAEFGIVFFGLLNVYSMWLILRHRLYHRTVDPRSHFLVYWAIALNTLVLAAFLLLFLSSWASGLR